MKILLINDDFYHPAIVSTEGVKPLRTQGFDIDIMGDGADFANKALTDYAVVLFVKSDSRTALDRAKWVTEDVRSKLAEYVRGGGGLLVVHSGTAGYGGMGDMHALFGGLFMTHPAQLPVTFQPKAGHPLTWGVEAFTQTDEHYFMDMAEGPVDVFLTGTSRHGTLPAGWARNEGRGRVCVLTPGHNIELWLTASFQQLLTNTLNWCAGK